MSDENQQDPGTGEPTQSMPAPGGIAPVPPATIQPRTAAAAHGVVARIESELEKEYAKGRSHFLVWIKTAIFELKQHLKV